MKELQELRNEVLSLRNMGEITKQTEIILLHKLNALKAAINYTHSCKSDSELLPNKWKERCLLAENYINETPCDPDIYQEQLEAWSEWITYKQSMENTK
tara:strand:+ start:125 stop:421 length:297 start_codon:yes stop_codon:yes gene_type:complete